MNSVEWNVIFGHLSALLFIKYISILQKHINNIITDSVDRDYSSKPWFWASRLLIFIVWCIFAVHIRCSFWYDLSKWFSSYRISEWNKNWGRFSHSLNCNWKDHIETRNNVNFHGNWNFFHEYKILFWWDANFHFAWKFEAVQCFGFITVIF